METNVVVSELSKRSRKLRYSTVQFDLNNPTSNALNFELFDTNVLSLVPDANLPPTPVTALGATPFANRSSSGIIYDSENRRYWVSNTFLNSIRVYDKDLSLITSIDTAGLGLSIDRLAYDSTNNQVFASQSTLSSIVVFNTNTFSQTTTISAGVEAFDIIVAENANTLYSIDRAAGVVNPISLTTYNVGAAFGALTTPLTGAYNFVRNKLYVSDVGTGSVHIFNTITNAPITTIGALIDPIGISYASNIDQVYFHSATLGVISRIDGNTNALIAGTVAVVGSLTNAVFGSRSGDVYFISTGVAPSLFVIDTSTFTLTSTISLGVGAIGTSAQIAYDFDKNYVYATTDSALITYFQEFTSASQFNIGGSTIYNQFIRDNLNNPKKVDRIMIYAEDFSQIENPMQVQVENANGIQADSFFLPNTKVSANQFFESIAQINFENLILNAGTSIFYTLNAFSVTKFVVYYKELKKSDLLSGMVYFSKFDAIKPNNPNTYTEKSLKESAAKPAYHWSNLMQTANFVKSEQPHPLYVASE